LADPGLSSAQRGVLVRELAGRVHTGPFGEPVRVSRASLDRWIRAWRAGGFDALLPTERQVQPRTDAGVLELAERLKRERPARTAAHIARVIEADHGCGNVNPIWPHCDGLIWPHLMAWFGVSRRL
jgi:putative transposase